MNILFLVLHRKGRSPGQRYRHEQYVSFFEENGISCTFNPLLKTKKEDQIFYGSRLLPKIAVGFKALYRRLISVATAHRYDAVYIYRDAFFFGTFYEKWLKRKNVKIVYDFDDAIWLMDKNEKQGIFNKLKDPGKTSLITSLADKVVVGNEYLASYARKYNTAVSIIPSTIDFDEYRISNHHVQEKRICIGWTGSFSTIKHFETVVPTLVALKKIFKEKVYFKLIGDPDYQNSELELQGVAWQAATEAKDLSELDIGIMPLPNNEWTQGKCGMKGLQYMALGIATVMSPVGLNTTIIQNGINGFLADSAAEWTEKLSLLITNDELRKSLGKQAKTTVLKKYSKDANKEKWLSLFTS